MAFRVDSNPQFNYSKDRKYVDIADLDRRFTAGEVS